MNLIDALRHHARMRPFDLAVIHPTGVANYLQLAGAVAQLSLKLRSHDIGSGVTAAIYVADPFLHLALVLAAMVNGTRSISAHPNYDPMPPGAGVDIILADRELAFATPATLVPVGANWLTDTSRDAPPAFAGQGFADPHAVARMYTSSGTTGLPKVIGHSCANMQAQAHCTLSIEPLVRGPNLSMMALSTIGGFGMAHNTLWHGATLVLATAPLHILRSINMYQVKWLRASPQQLQGLVDMVRGRAVRFPSLERLEVGGASTPASLIHLSRALLCTNVVGAYGSTEAGLVAQTPAAVLSAQPDAAGYVVPGVDLRIVDEAGQPVGAGTEGTVQIRSPYMVDRYIGDETATAASFQGGWFVPGDLGILGADGLLRITGRIDEMINAGGVKLSPALVDDFLLSQPGVRDAAAFAYRQSGLADQVWAAVVCTDPFDEQALLAACRARLNSRAPLRLLRVEQIPRNAMGKAMRQQLTQQASKPPILRV